jgi:hypothetical protein
MRAFRFCLCITILATMVFGSVSFATSPQKQVDSRDTELRLMAMLYVSATTPY